MRTNRNRIFAIVLFLSIVLVVFTLTTINVMAHHIRISKQSELIIGFSKDLTSAANATYVVAYTVTVNRAIPDNYCIFGPETSFITVSEDAYVYDVRVGQVCRSVFSNSAEAHG